MRLSVLAATFYLTAAVVQQHWSAHAAVDGFVTREEAIQIVQTPLDQTIGRVEAEQVKRVAVASAMLEHCSLDGNTLFQSLMSHHRSQQGRSEAEMSRVSVWHGVWQGQVLTTLRRDRPVCDEETRRVALGNAARQVRTLTPSGNR